MGKMESAHHENLYQISQAQLVAYPVKDNQYYNICRILKEVERSTAALIECSLALFTPECSITESSFLCSFICAGGCTMWTVHLWATPLLLSRRGYQKK